MASPKEINYHNGEKLYNKEKVDALLAEKQDVITPDTTVQDNDHLVENQAIKAYVDAETQRAKRTEGNLDNLTTTNKSSLVEAINEVKQSGFTVDPNVSGTSTNPVASTGVKAYVDDQDTATLQSAEQYTNEKIGTLEPEDGSTVVELTGHLSDLDNASESLVSAINKEGDRITALENKAASLDDDLSAEQQARIAGDRTLDTKITRIEQGKQDKLTFDDEPTHGSDNPVKSTGIKDYVDEITGQLADLDIPSESLVSAINKLVQRVPETEEAPTEDSDKIAKSGGTWDAIRFASVKVGETMYWHLQDDSSPEDRVVHSDNPFVFTFKGQEISVETQDGHVQLCMLKDIPNGWHALDGKAELLATDYPDLAAFMPENVTTDGKIWLPYVQHKIIKVKY